jgi:hypothetical protein
MIPTDADVAAVLAVSDERDRWLARLLAAERDAYRRGYSDGQAEACIILAEAEDRYLRIAWWREFAARVRRIISVTVDPDTRMQQAMREIAADQRFIRDARNKKPGDRLPMESAVLRRIHFVDPGDAAS